MKKTGRIALMTGALAFAVIPLLSQTSPTPKPSFEVTSIKPSAPNLNIRGGGPRGDRYTMSGVTLKNLLQQAYSRPSSGGLPYPLFSRRNDRSFASMERGESPVWSQMMPLTIICR